MDQHFFAIGLTRGVNCKFGHYSSCIIYCVNTTDNLRNFFFI